MTQVNTAVYRKNLGRIRKHSLELSRDLEVAGMPSDRLVVTTPAGEPTLLVKDGNSEVAIHSRYQPAREAEVWASGLEEAWDLMVVFGFGLGYHAEALVKKHPDRMVIAVEPDLGNVKLAMVHRDLSTLLRPGKLALVVGEKPRDVASQLAAIAVQNAGKKVVFQAIPAYQQLYGSFWHQVCHEVTNQIRQRRVNWATTENFKVQWLVNFRDNFKAYLQSYRVSSLFGAFSGKPAIIVAAGPSLEKNIELLPFLAGRALLIAAGSANKILEKHGIKPHLLVSFDPGEANYQHFADFDGRDIPLVYAPVIFPKIIQEYQGPLFGCELNVSPFIGWFDRRLEEDKGLLVSGPSVANVCLDLAVKLGADPIILIGQDLAFTGNKTHADGAAHQKQIDPSQAQYIWVEDVFGGRVPTTTAFYSMLVWFEQYLNALGGLRKVIDATEGGAKISGTRIMTLAEVARTYLTEAFHPEDIIRQKINQASDGKLKSESERYARLDNAFAELRSQREQVHGCFTEGLEVGQNLLAKCEKGTLKPQAFDKALRKFTALDRRISSNSFYQLFVAGGVAARVDAINRILAVRANREGQLAIRAQSLAMAYLSFFREVEQYAGFAGQILDQIEASFAPGIAHQ